MSRPRILCVDDEPKVLEGLVAFLRRRYRVFTASNGAKGLVTLHEHGPFAVVVSDMRMPGMDGAAFLAEAAVIAPETTRILLTGHAEQRAALRAVNEGGVFRFLTKPCPPTLLLRAVQDGVELHQLRRAERELLQDTLRGSVGVLSEVMALAAPALFGRANRIQRTVRGVVLEMGLAEPWKYELAAMLSQVGLVGVPEHIVRRANRGAELDPDEQDQIDHHPDIARRLLERIPRIEDVTQMVAHQRDGVTVAQAAQAMHNRDTGALGAQILKAASDLDSHQLAGDDASEALDRMRAAEAAYNPAVLRAMEALFDDQARPARQVRVDQLMPGMVLMEAVRTRSGTEVVPAGHEVTSTLRTGLLQYAQHDPVEEPLWVQLPAMPPQVAADVGEPREGGPGARRRFG